VRVCAWTSLVLSCLVMGCASPQDEAKRELKRELRERNEARAEAESLLASGLKAHRSTDLDRASDRFGKATSRDPRFGEAWLALGVVEAQRGNAAEAVSALERASSLMPSNPEPSYNLGIVYEKAGLFERAVDAYERALALEPGALRTIENLARAHIRSGRSPEHAAELLRAAARQELRPEWSAWIATQLRLIESWDDLARAGGRPETEGQQ